MLIFSCAAVSFHNYPHHRELVLAAADDLFQAIGRETVAEFESIYQPVEMLVDLLAHQQLGNATTLAERMAGVSYVADALGHSRSLSALYVGYADGDFFLLRPLRENAAARAQFRAPPAAAFLVQSVERRGQSSPRGTQIFLDDTLREVERRDVPDYVFDPRTRGWYQEAIGMERQIRTAPYVFFSTREVGVTFARRAEGAAAAVGADLTLRDLSRALQRQKLSPSSELVLFNAEGFALAYGKPDRIAQDARDASNPRLAKVSELGSPALAALMERFAAGATRDAFSLSVDGREWKGAINPLQIEGAARGAYLAMLIPQDELLGDARRISRESLLITLSIVLVSIPVAWLLSRLVANPLRVIAREARAVQRFDFASPAATRSAVKEIDELGATMDTMKSTIRQFLGIAATISAERNFDRLLERVLAETIAAAGSDAGAIYLFDDERRTLTSAAARSGSNPVTAPPIADDDAAFVDHPVRRAVAAGSTVVTRLDPDPGHLARLFGSLGRALGDHSRTAIAVLLRNRTQEIIGSLCLFSDAATGDVPRELVSFIEALSGTAAIAIENQALLKAQKALLESFIRLVAGAIDAKSPYTGGHCQRVPELTRMIAEAASEAKARPFREIYMHDDQLEALRIAAWLHDCGKVTTPEYVVDKATKLETIYDRLHEIRMRFEVLKRDAEIDYWRQAAASGEPAPSRAALETKWRALEAEFAFVAACNTGGESMAPETVERIRRIAERTWVRTLDDRIGLSRDERARKDRAPAPPLPVVEHLLADKPEHLVDRAEANVPENENPWGFRIPVPRHKYNYGEVYNLRIGRGTLNEEERYKISEHVVQTIIMLSRLPFPRHLKTVPEIAGGHHERLDGTGYPRGLTRAEMSVQARIVALADIFEALTAADRPYKQGKTLSEAIGIMDAMCRDGHIDPELFELFLTSGVYRRYAERYMLPSQFDEVDVSAYVEPARSPP